MDGVLYVPDSLIDFAVSSSRRSRQPRRWTHAELDFVRSALGELSYPEIGQALGRSPDAVKIVQTRRGLGAPSRKPGYFTTTQVAQMLGTDDHAVMRWVRLGLLAAGRVAGERGIVRISKRALYGFATNPENWIYFHPERVRDGALCRLIARKRAGWGDEWWTTGQVARHFGLASSNTVHAAIQRGCLPARRWGNWYVKRSDVLAYGFTPGRGSRKLAARHDSPRADAFLLKAREQWGLSFARIDRLMKTHPGRAAYRYGCLVREREKAAGGVG